MKQFEEVVIIFVKDIDIIPLATTYMSYNNSVIAHG